MKSFLKGIKNIPEKRDLLDSFASIAYAIWLDKNDLIFQNKKPSVQNTFLKAKKVLIKNISPLTSHTTSLWPPIEKKCFLYYY